MDTAQHPTHRPRRDTADAAHHAVLRLWQRVAGAWQRWRMNPHELFVAESADLAQLERRLRMLERDGWPPR